MLPQLATCWIAVNLPVADQPALLPSAPCVNADRNAIVLHVDTSRDDRRIPRDLTGSVKLRTLSQSFGAKLCANFFLPRLTKDGVDKSLEQRRIILAAQKLNDDLLPAFPPKGRIQRGQVKPNGTWVFTR